MTIAYDAKLKAKHNGTIVRIGKYKSICKSLKHKCLKCGAKWKMVPNNVLRCASERRCPECSIAFRWTTDRYEKELVTKHGNDLAISGKFSAINSTAEHTCRCGHVWEPICRHILNGHGCPKCAQQRASVRLVKPESVYDAELAKVQPNIVRKEPYVNDRTCIKHKCRTCKLKWYPSPNNLLRGYGCPTCNTPLKGHSGVCIEWLEHEAKTRGIFIQHAQNLGEHKIRNTRYRVDGYHRESRTVFEFHGDAFHGNHKRFKDKDKPNPFSNRTAAQLYEKTLEREKRIRALGYKLVVMWESDWLNQRVP